ncbi:MAG: hypothetical protein AB7D27_10935 [Desulfomicrobium sp.]
MAESTLPLPRTHQTGSGRRVEIDVTALVAFYATIKVPANLRVARAKEEDKEIMATKAVENDTSAL